MPLISGLMFGLSFPPVNFSILVIFAFVVYLFILDCSENYKQVFVRTYILFFTFELFSVSWITLSGLREGADSFLIIGGLLTMILHTLYFVIPSLVYFFLKKQFSSKRQKCSYLFFIPFGWVAVEYFQLQGQLNFPWLLLSYSHSASIEKVQYIDVTGMFGVTFWICTMGCLLFYMIKKIGDGEWKIKRRKIVSLAVLILLIYFLPNLYNSVADPKEKFSNKLDEGTVKIGIIQPNINPWKKWGAKQTELIESYLEQITEMTNANPSLDLIVLPETALPFHFSWNIHDEKYLMIKQFVDTNGIPVLVGTPELQIYNDPKDAPVDAKKFSNGLLYDTYNSSVLIEPGKDKSNYTFHHKMKLVAASERMPYQEKLTFLQDMIKWSVGLSSFQIGRDTLLFELPGSDYKFNVAICYESVYPDFFAKYVNRGADFSLIITNDGWWGKFFGTYQHNQYAVFRSIENRRWIGRSANTGISCFIDPYGNILNPTGIDVKTFIEREIGIVKEKTFYTENGDLIAIYSSYVGGFVLLIGIVLKIKRRFI